MRRIARILPFILLAALLAGCAHGASAAYGGSDVQLFAASVGKGDALILRVDGWTGLIDAGKPHAMGRVRAALEAMGIQALDAVFLTHTDDDHAGGLEWLAESDLPVGAWYASAMYTGVKPKKHPAVRAAAARGQEVAWLRRGDAVPLGDTGAVLRVLAPHALNEQDEDDNSLVMMLETAQGRVLLTGDMELPEEAALLGQGDDLACAALKAPNHGDDDTLSEAFARAASAQVAVISTDSGEKPGTPDPGVIARLEAAGTACFVTQDAGLGVRVALANGEARAERVDLDVPPIQGPAITAVAAGDDLVTLYNGGGDIDLTGWYLHSERGDELYAFPAGCALAAGQSLTVGTRSSPEGAFDLLWDDKKVIHRSKEDSIALYDPWGRCVDRMSNGL